MRRKRLLWKLFPIFFVVTLASVLVLLLFVSNSLRDFYYSQIRVDLETRTRMMRIDVAEALASQPSNTRAIEELIRSLAETSGTRVTVIARDGMVIADSEHDPGSMEDHSDRPEFQTALAGRVGVERRVSPTLGVSMLYLSMPIKRNGSIAAVLRTSLRADALDAVPALTCRRIAAAALLIAIFAGVVSILAARRISGPITGMKEAAMRFAAGDFRSRVPIPDTEEFAGLADALNTMASQLDSHVRTITEQAGEQNAILASMQEGVLAIDNDDRVLIVNPAAERLLGVDLDAVKGKTIQESIRNPDLQRFIDRSRRSSGPATDEILLRETGDRVVQITGAALMNAGGARIGVLVVLNEVTRTRKLEALRRDFVANVSHELKTPITSIKGFVETLREGALSDPAKAREFLEIVGRQADRLDAIIEDLLSLSKIEQEAEAAEIALEMAPIRPVLEAAALDCQSKAASAGVSVTVVCDDQLRSEINAPLLEQAVANLLDNAIKYTPQGEVTITAEDLGPETAIRVTDTGCGIEAEHLPRLFERFYRVDKARSRKLGGTGLGLAIVKHIVQAHRGRIEVQSFPGKGSTFSLFIPKT